MLVQNANSTQADEHNAGKTFKHGFKMQIKST